MGGTVRSPHDLYPSFTYFWVNTILKIRWYLCPWSIMACCLFYWSLGGMFPDDCSGPTDSSWDWLFFIVSFAGIGPEGWEIHRMIVLSPCAWPSSAWRCTPTLSFCAVPIPIFLFYAICLIFCSQSFGIYCSARILNFKSSLLRPPFTATVSSWGRRGGWKLWLTCKMIVECMLGAPLLEFKWPVSITTSPARHNRKDSSFSS